MLRSESLNFAVPSSIIASPRLYSSFPRAWGASRQVVRRGHRSHNAPCDCIWKLTSTGVVCPGPVFLLYLFAEAMPCRASPHAGMQ